MLESLRKKLLSPLLLSWVCLLGLAHVAETAMSVVQS